MTDRQDEQIPIGWEGLRNARDLGGLPLLGDGLTQPRTVIRSDTPVRLTSAGLEQALRHPLGTVIDLREEHLAATQPNPLKDAPGVVYHHLPLLPEDFPLPVIRGGYREALDAARPQMAAVLRALLGGCPPAFLHCHSGTGRTGLVAVVLLELTGVTTETIVADFRASLGPRHSEEWEVPEQLLGHLRRRYGGVRGYLATAGLTPQQLDSLSRLLRSRGAPHTPADEDNPTRIGILAER